MLLNDNNNNNNNNFSSGIKRSKITLYYKESKKTFKNKYRRDRKRNDFNNKSDFTAKLRRRFYKTLSFYNNFFSLSDDRFNFNFNDKLNGFSEFSNSWKKFKQLKKKVRY